MPELGEHAREVTALVCGAWRDLLEEVRAGRSYARATEVARELDLRPKLGWQVWRVMHATDPLEALDHMPGPGAIESVIRAARQRGASAQCADQLHGALREFGELVRRHAGDRQALAMMLAQGSPNEDADEEHRRHGFLAASYLWGVQARAFLMVSIVHPGATDEVVDVAALRGLIDLRRLRPNLPWIIARTGCRPEEGQTRFGPYREPVCPAADPGRAPVLEEFCAPRALHVRALQVSPTLVDTELPAGPVGDTGLLTCMTAEVFRRLPKYRSREFPAGTIAPFVLTPCKALVHDILVHPGTGGPRPIRTVVYGDARGEGFAEPCERNTLPVRASMRHLGRGMQVVSTPWFPRYAAMVEHVHAKLGWERPGQELEVYRLVLRYPVMPSQVATQIELPERPVARP